MTAIVITDPSGQTYTLRGKTYTRRNIQVDENQTEIFTATANKPVTWSIIPVGKEEEEDYSRESHEADLFEIDSNTGVLKFKVAPDYENPQSSSLKNNYDFYIQATDNSGNKVRQWVEVEVLDIPDSGNPENLKNGTQYLLYGIKDYDGNRHGYLGDAPDLVKSAYKYQGRLDVNNDGTTEAIFTNKESGRWVTASLDPITGTTDYSKHGQGGTTRIVGIYEDPLVKAGLVEKNSDLDGSRAFINDLKLDNLILKTVGDYDSDGFQEVYWSKVDNTAYLRAVMHIDGNIQYANYQNLDQMTNYLTSNGFEDTVALIT